MKQLFEVKYVFDTVADDNKKRDENFERVKFVHNKMQSILPIYNPDNAEEEIIGYKDTILDKAIMFEQEQGIPLLTYEQLNNIIAPSSRLDFAIMVMKAVNYNPYEDQQFMKDLFKLGLKNSIPDIDTSVNAQGRYLTLNEKVWLLYAKYKNVMQGDDGDGYKFKPYNNITRKEAMGIAGKLIKNQLNVTPSQGLVTTKVERYNIDDYQRDLIETTFYSNFKESIDLCLQYGVITGQKINDSNNVLVNSYLALESQLSTREGVIISLAIHKALNLNTYLHNMVDGGEISDSSQCYTCSGQVDDATNTLIITGSFGLPQVIGGTTKTLVINTQVNEELANKFNISLTPLFGDISNFTRSYDNNDFLKISFDYSAPIVESEHTIPLVINFITASGKKYSKDQYVQVVPDDGYNIDENNTPLTTQLSHQYRPELDQFTINWQGTSSVRQVTIYSSFDNTNWTQVLSQSQQQGTQAVAIANSKSHNQIYFKIKSTDDADNSSTSNASLFYYSPKKDINTPKQTEKPAVPPLGGLGDSTSKSSVTLRWKRVNDSNNKDNVNYYEVEYADNYRFENATIVNAANNAAGVNIYESASFTVNNLQDEKKYYFRVRAINGVGTSAWSSYESIKINIEDLPYFDNSYQKPVSGNTGTSKTPLLKWRAYDSDGDDLDYYVLMGETPETMYSVRSFGAKGDQNWLDYNTELNKILKPDTTYYWQVKVKEKGHYKDYYGGEYIKSPIWSFTTVSTGPDLTISSVQLMSEIQPDSEATFRLTVRNVGSEVADDEFIQGYYRKGTKTTPFHNGSARMATSLAPGETEVLDITVKFRDEVIEGNSYNGYQERDNVLGAGESFVIFDMPRPDEQDVNSTNNSFETAINYVDQGKPIFEQFYVGSYSVYFHQKSWALYTAIGRSLSINFDATDDLQIIKATIEYRLNTEAQWQLLETYTNSDDSLGRSYSWQIPEDKQFVTDEAQIRVRVYENESSFEERISYAFPIHSNDIQFAINNFDKTEYTVGDSMNMYFTNTSDNPISNIEVTLYSNGRQEEVFKLIGGSHCSSSDVSGCLNLGGILSFNLPNQNKYANSNAYLSIRIVDRYSNIKTITSDGFVINPTAIEIPAFDNAKRLFVNPALPVNAKYTNQYSGMKFVRLDENGIAHAIVEYKEEYLIDTASGKSQDTSVSKIETYYYTYDKQTDTVSTKLKIPNGVVSLEINENNIPYILIQDGRQLYYSYKQGGSFVNKVNLVNPVEPSVTSSFRNTTSISDIDDKNDLILVGNYIYELEYSYNKIKRYSFNNGTITGGEIVIFAGDVDNSRSIYSKIKPVSYGNIIYTLDESWINKLDLATNTRKKINLPFTLGSDEFKEYSVAIQVFNNNLYFFARGEVYQIVDNELVKVSNIEYAYDGQLVDFKAVWNNTKRIMAIPGDDKIYLILENYYLNKPLHTKYDVLEFDVSTNSFSKKIIKPSQENLSTSFRFGSGVEDWINVGNGKLLILSDSDLNLSDINYNRLGLSIFDLVSGDIIHLDDLSIPSSRAKFMKNSSGLYLGVEEPNYIRKVYSLNLSNTDQALDYFDYPRLKKANNKIIATYRYGEVFDGRDYGQLLDDKFVSINDVNKPQAMIELYPNQSAKYDMSSNYVNSRFNYNYDYVSFPSTAEIYHALADGTVGEFSFDYGEDYKNSMYPSVKSFNTNLVSVFAKSEDHYLIVDDELKSQKLSIQSKYGDTANVIAYDDFILAFHTNTNNENEIVKFDLTSSKAITIPLTVDIDSFEQASFSDANSAGLFVLGWDDGSPYIGVADLSEDISVPTISINNSETFIENGQSISLEWTASDNNDELFKYEVYKIVGGVEELISTINNTSQTDFSYMINETNVSNIVFKVVAYDFTGNKNSNSLSLELITPISINSFAMNKSSMNLGEKIIFSWGVTGSAANTSYSIYKQRAGSDVWNKVTTVIAETSVIVTVEDFAGQYYFKLVSGNESLQAEGQVNIQGELLLFENELFIPSGHYSSDSQAVNLQWADSLTGEHIVYSVWVKKPEELDFSIIGTTFDKSFDYNNVTDAAFTWKVSALFNNQYIESDEQSATPISLQSPDIKSANFTIIENKPEIKLTFDPDVNATNYVIAREVEGSYKEIAITENTFYNDTDIHYGLTYTYKIISQYDRYRAEVGIETDIKAELDEKYTVSITNENYQKLQGNSLALEYLPSTSVSYESYEILIGNDPNSLDLYTKTQSNTMTVDGLGYAQTYYIEVYPIDYNGVRITTVPAKLTFTTGFDNRVIDDDIQISLNEIATEHISMSWNSVENTDYYLVCRSENQGDYICFAQTTDLSYIDYVNLQSESTYSYIVKAVNSNVSISSSESSHVSLPTESVDSDAPVVTAPSNITVAATDANGTDATDIVITTFLATSTANDVVDGSVAVSFDAPAIFPLGVTTVTFSAVDNSSNVGNAQATVTVTDQTAPVINATSIALFVTDVNGISINHEEIQAFINGVMATDNVDGAISVNHNIPSQIQVGTTQVVFTAIDKAGLETTKQVSITISMEPDTEAPVVADLFPLVAEATGQFTFVELVNPTFTDEYPEQVEVSVDNAGPYALGETSIIWTVTDSSGNSATATQVIRVVDTTAPIFEDIATLTINARGLLTDITKDINVMAFDLVDGEVTATIVSEINAITQWVSGQHIVQLAAQDATGNKSHAQLTVNINPIVQLGQDVIVEAGGVYKIPVTLSGAAAVYPVTVTYKLDGSVTSASSTELVFAQGTEQLIEINISNMAVAGDQAQVTLVSATNALIVGDNLITATVIEANHSPLVELVVKQTGKTTSVIDPTAGIVTVVATVTDVNQADQHSLIWRVEDNAINGVIDVVGEGQYYTFTFNPSSLESGHYLLSVSVAENNTSELLGIEREIVLVVESELAVLSTELDTDNDNIPDAQEGYADSDQDGIVDYLDNDSDNTRLPLGTNSSPLQTTNGLKLSLGDIVRATTGVASENAQLLASDITKYVNGDATADDNSIDHDFTAVSSIISFNVDGLNPVGASAPVVLPLANDKFIPDKAVYRKYNVTDGWFDFVTDHKNTLSSALKDSDGNCPAPLSSTYLLGLNAGDNCIQLVIEDGGANDADAKANGMVKDPGVLAVKATLQAPIISASPLAIADTEFKKGDQEKVVLAFMLNADSPDAQVSQLTIAASGDINEMSDIGAVRLYRDDNKNGIAEANERVAEGLYLSDNGQITFSLPEAYQLPVGADNAPHFLVTYQF